jgi:hypothetical protein
MADKPEDDQPAPDGDETVQVPPSPLAGKHAAQWQYALWLMRQKNAAGRPPL